MCTKFFKMCKILSMFYSYIYTVCKFLLSQKSTNTSRLLPTEMKIYPSLFLDVMSGGHINVKLQGRGRRACCEVLKVGFADIPHLRWQGIFGVSNLSIVKVPLH